MHSMDMRLGAFLALVALQGAGAIIVRMADEENAHAEHLSVAIGAEGVVTRSDDKPAVALEASESAETACEAEGKFEDALDILSWKFFASPMGAGGAPVVRSQVTQAGMQERQRYIEMYADAADSAVNANAGLAAWMQAVERTQKLAKNATALLPPGCPSHVPASDQFWAEPAMYVDKHGRHNVCRYSNDCKKEFTNLERLNSIRKTTLITHQFLEKFGVQHGLYGGTAIGAYRCQDILPWDKDSDVFVVQEDVHKILKFVENIENDGTGFLGRHIDMGTLGAEFEGFALHVKHPGCMPFVVVDKSTGFFTDVFPMRAVGSQALSPFWGVRMECDSQNLFNGCRQKKCRHWSLENTLPPSKCKIGDDAFTCPAKLHPWLVEQFGSDVGTQANKATRGASE